MSLGSIKKKKNPIATSARLPGGCEGIRLFHYRGLKRVTFVLKQSTETSTKFEDKIKVIF